MGKEENHQLSEIHGSNHPEELILQVICGEGVEFFLIFHVNRVYLKTKKGSER
jgi:hypothetical protein